MTTTLQWNWAWLYLYSRHVRIWKFHTLTGIDRPRSASNNFMRIGGKRAGGFTGISRRKIQQSKFFEFSTSTYRGRLRAQHSVKRTCGLPVAQLLYKPARNHSTPYKISSNSSLHRIGYVWAILFPPPYFNSMYNWNTFRNTLSFPCWNHLLRDRFFIVS